MNKAERASLLRRRFRATGGLPYTKADRPPRTVVERVPPAKIYFPLPECTSDTKRAGKWMHEPNPKPKSELRTKRNQGVSALTKIAAKWRSVTERLPAG